MKACLLTVSEILKKLIWIKKKQSIDVNDYTITKMGRVRGKTYSIFKLEKYGKQLEKLILEDVLFFIVNGLGTGPEFVTRDKYIVMYPEDLKQDEGKIAKKLRGSYSYKFCPEEKDVEPDQSITKPENFVTDLLGADMFYECVHAFKRNVFKVEHNLLKFRMETMSENPQELDKEVDERLGLYIRLITFFNKQLNVKEEKDRELSYDDVNAFSNTLSVLVSQFQNIVKNNLNFKEYNEQELSDYATIFQKMKREKKEETC
jgi:hypothetical protein